MQHSSVSDSFMQVRTYRAKTPEALDVVLNDALQGEPKAEIGGYQYDQREKGYFCRVVLPNENTIHTNLPSPLERMTWDGNTLSTLVRQYGRMKGEDYFGQSVADFIEKYGLNEEDPLAIDLHISTGIDCTFDPIIMDIMDIMERGLPEVARTQGKSLQEFVQQFSITARDFAQFITGEKTGKIPWKLLAEHLQMTQEDLQKLFGK